MEKIKMSLIINVLESYEIIKRQILYYSINYNKLKNWELIIIDDGSTPSIVSFLKKNKNFKISKLSYFEGLEVYEYLFPINFVIINTKNKKLWSNSSARNLGARYCNGKYILFNDIDHFYPKKAIEEALSFEGSKMHHHRHWGVLLQNGEIIKNKNKIIKYLKTGVNLNKNLGTPYNIFLIKKEIFTLLNGYNENFDGKYGKEDIDFHQRFGQLVYKNKINKGINGKEKIFVYPDPAEQNKYMFHTLSRR